MKKLIKITNILALIGAIVAAGVSLFIGDKQDVILYLILTYLFIIVNKLDNTSDKIDKCI